MQQYVLTNPQQQYNTVLQYVLTNLQQQYNTVLQYAPRQYTCGTLVHEELDGISTFLRFSAVPGRERAVPGGAFSRSPLVELDTFGHYVAGDTEG